MELSQQILQDLHLAFQLFDFDSDNLISVNDFEKLIRGLGLTPTNKEMQDFIKQRKEGFDFDSFLQVYIHLAKNQKQNELDLQEMFKDFETDSGELELEKFKNFITSIGEPLSNEEFDKIIKKIEKDGKYSSKSD